uniref:N-acetyltransferase domain-containing protein n=1 Tax=Lutzomyia longipalpis TaxID=7200 RepID=A0A7G3B292_LUTLO
MTWKRPENVAFPQVWLTFEAKDPDTGKIVKYRVQDLPEDRFDEVLNLMSTIFLRDETMCRSLDILNDPDLKGRSGKSIWDDILKQKISLVCFKEGSDEICGVNVLEVLEKDVKGNEMEIKSSKIQALMKAMEFMKAQADTYNRYGVDKFLHAMGLLVVPKYRGLGLSTEILKARVPLGRALGLKLTGTVFTGIASQNTAAKAGFVEDYSVLYEDMGKKEPFVEFPNISTPYCKFMSLRLD